MAAPILDGFEIHQRGSVTVCCLRALTVVREALFHPETCTPLRSAGRGEILQFALPDGAGLIRPYRRGGFVRHFVRNRYLRNRPLAELRVHLAAEARGIPVPQVLGVRWSRNAFGLLEGAIATRMVQAQTLQDYLMKQDADPAVVGACGVVIRQTHDAGIDHQDLQVRNVLITPGGPLLIDFDKAIDRGRLQPRQRAYNLLRLRRSFQKNHLSLDAYDLLIEGYGGIEFPAWLERVYAGRGRVSDRLANRPDPQ